MKVDIIYNNQVYYKIYEFDCKVISLQATPDVEWTTKNGSFFTVIPISEHHDTKKKLILERKKDHVVFNIYDDGVF